MSDASDVVRKDDYYFKEFYPKVNDLLQERDELLEAAQRVLDEYDSREYLEEMSSFPFNELRSIVAKSKGE